MLDVRDRILDVLDSETLADLAARTGTESMDPRGLHAEALAATDPDRALVPRAASEAPP